MPVNVKLLKKVRKLIAEEPRRLRMRVWGLRYDKDEITKSLPPCGTTACLAGHIILATKPKRDWKSLFDRLGRLAIANHITGNFNNAAWRASKLIGLPIEECPFGNTHWHKRQVLAWIDKQIAKAK